MHAGICYSGMRNVSANKALQQQAESQSDSEIDEAEVQIVEGNNDVVPFTIICMGTSQKENETIGENVKKALDEFVQEYQELGSLELVLLGQYTGEVKDASVLAEKSTDTSAIVNRHSQFNNFVANFSETKKAIFNEVVGSDVLEVTDEGIKTSLTADEQDSTQVPKISITAGMKKYVVLGLAAGLFLAVLCYGLYYIFTGTVKTKREFERGYGLYCLGNLAETQRKTSFDRPCRNYLVTIMIPWRIVEILQLQTSELCA